MTLKVPNDSQLRTVFIETAVISSLGLLSLEYGIGASVKQIDLINFIVLFIF